MIRSHEIRRVLRPQAEVFAYTAAYENSADWHPSVFSAEKVDDGPPRIGATYRLEVKFAGATIPLSYEIAEYEPHYRVVLSGRGPSLDAVDEIRFIEDGENTVIDYTVTLNLQSWARLLQPVTRPLIRRTAARAIDALVASLEG